MPSKKNKLDAGFAAAFGGAPARYFSAPGRAEIGGNHTDHQRGCVLPGSGHSSYMYLQNVIPAGYKSHQDVAVALALCEHYLNGRGAYRVHGGGFAGTVQAFVPNDLLDSFVAGIDGALGKGACHVLSIRPQGGVPAVVEG